MRVILDADSIIYKAGFAVEQVVYDVVCEDGDGDMVSAQFDDPRRAGEWIHSVGADPELASIEAVREAEPVENALQIVKTMLEEIRDNTKPDELTIVLSGKTNFRDRVAKVKPYKGNRDKAHKPVHFQALYDYIRFYRGYGALISNDCEADDVVSTVAHSCRENGLDYLVAAIDKDLEQIPGDHYDFSKKVFYFVTREDAERQFWRQCLTGDASDNVGGVYRMGPKKADAWLGDCYRPDWERVVEVYESSQRLPNCPYADRDAESVALENAQLVYIQQKPGELWLPHGRRGRTIDV